MAAEDQSLEILAQTCKTLYVETGQKNLDVTLDGHSSVKIDDLKNKLRLRYTMLVKGYENIVTVEARIYSRITEFIMSHHIVL